MKKIILSAVVATVTTVSVYHLALIAGVNPVFVAFAFAVAFAAAVAFADASAVAIAASAFAAATAATAAADASAVAVAAFAVAAAAAFVFADVIINTAAVSEKRWTSEKRWKIAAYAIEALVIWGVLVVGHVGWSVGIAAGGVGALLVLWRIVPEPNAVAQTTDAHAAERVRLGMEIRDLESQLDAKREALARLDAPLTAPIPERNGG